MAKNITSKEIETINFQKIEEHVFCENYLIDGEKPKIKKHIYKFSEKMRSEKEEGIDYCQHHSTFHIYRYEPANHIQQLIDDHKLSFTRLSKWQDPFESLFYEKGININGEKYDVLCKCYKYDWIIGEEADWISYGEGAEIVRVEYNFKQFCKFLSEIGEKEQINFYISIVDYSIPRQSLKLLKEEKEVFKSINEYLTYLSLKRRAYTHEKEIRVFAVKENSIFPDEDGVLFFKDVPEITLFSHNHYLSDENEDFKDDSSALITEIVSHPSAEAIAMLKKSIHKKCPSFEVRHSKIYDI